SSASAAMRDARPLPRLGLSRLCVLRRKPLEVPISGTKPRDGCPGSASAERAVEAEPGLACAHDRLVTVFDADLVENARDVVAHRLLGQLQGGGNLAIVEAAGNAFEHRTLACRELVERQGAAGRDLRLRQKFPHLADELRPCRLFGKRHMVLAVEGN